VIKIREPAAKVLANESAAIHIQIVFGCQEYSAMISGIAGIGFGGGLNCWRSARGVRILVFECLAF
jgi:hypothetical protein